MSLNAAQDNDSCVVEAEVVMLGPDTGTTDAPLLARIDALERQLLGQSGMKSHLKPISRLEELEVEVLRAPQKGGMVERVCASIHRIFHTTHDLQ